MHKNYFFTVKQIKIFQNVNEILEFKLINIKKLQENKMKYIPGDKLKFSFEVCLDRLQH